jgi:phasin
MKAWLIEYREFAAVPYACYEFLAWKYLASSNSNSSPKPRYGRMTTDKSGFEVPEQMRDFAEKSVDQARKAFDDFMGATHKAVSNVEDSAQAVQSGAADVNKKALGYAEEHVNSAFKFAQELVKASTVEDMMKLQQDYLRSQMEALGEQAREFSNTATKAVSEATKAAQKD